MDSSVATRTETSNRPTIYPYKNFNALQDAKLLEQAMKGKGCDEEAVINILCGRTWRQRQEIAAAYKHQHKKDLTSVLKSETSGDFEDVIVTLMQSPALNDAIMLKDAVKSKDHVILNTIAFTRKNEELHEIHRLYAEKHGSNLTDDIKKATSGYYEQLLLLSFGSGRDEDNVGTRHDVEGDARALWEAGPKRPGTNMVTYTTIFGRRSFAHLRQVFQAYQQITKTSIEKTVIDEMKGDDEKGFLALIKAIKNDSEFFVDQLVAATKGLGTNEKKLNHIIVSRAEIDLDTIADTYQRLHKQPLEKLIQSETSGEYQRALLALVRGNASGQKTEYFKETDGQQHPSRPVGTAANETFPVVHGNSASTTSDSSVVTKMEARDRPTVFPYRNFNALQDAQLLEQAMRGKGCDEEAVINILCARTWRQRQEIAAAYERQYRKELTSVLKSETSGDFEDVIVTLMQSPALNDAIMLKDAVKKKDHVILNTIAFTRKNEELREIRRLYAEKHGSNLIDDVTKATSEQYEQLLIHSLAGERDQDNTGDRRDVEGDARALWEAGPKRPGTNMATFVNIFARRSIPHLRQVFQAYQQLAKTSIEQTVIDEMKGDDDKGFLALIKVIKNDSEFFVDQIGTATKGLGTNEKKLNHIIVSRAEVDLDTIADTYQRLHKQPLEKLIQSETSGDYQRALLALVRGNAGGAGTHTVTGGQQHLPPLTGSAVTGGQQHLPPPSGTVVKLSESVTSTETPPDGSVATRTETRDRPTVYPYKNFNALQDAQLLEQAMRGKGCDEEAVINILCARTWQQRQEIGAAYERQYRKNLISVLKSETSGDFEDVIVTLMQSPALNDAIMLKDAVKKKDHVILNTIAFTRKNEELREIHRLYAEKHGSDLLDDVKKATTGYYEHLLLMSLAGQRDQENAGSRHDVEGDARALYEAGPKRPGTNMVTYTTIFGRRSFAHLRQVFQAYQQLTKTSIEQTVVDEMKGDDEKGFLSLIKVIKTDSEFFADQVVASTKGLGTSEKKLNHIIVSRAEIDLGTIADTYQRLHKQPLEKLVQSETSGDYQRALLALVRGNAQGTGGAEHYAVLGGQQHLPPSTGTALLGGQQHLPPSSGTVVKLSESVTSTETPPDGSVATRTETRDRPTVYPYKNFNALQDAALLEKAMKGKGCDEEAVINILCGRTWRQRQEIAAAYERQYRKNLISALKSETSGDFEDVIVTLMQSPALNDAIMLKDAAKKKDHVILNTIAFTRKNEELREIQRLYAEKHGENLLDAVKKATTGYYEQLLLLSFAGERDQNNVGDRRDVEGDARALWDAGPKRPGTNMATYVNIFARRSFAHLRQVFQAYQQITKTSIEQTVVDEMKGDDEKGFLALIKVIRNDAEFFCDQLVSATKGLGTNEKKLNHTIVSRAEIDLGTIADTYQRLRAQPLEKLIQSETSGDYQRALLALVRGNEQGTGGVGHYTGTGGQQLPLRPVGTAANESYVVGQRNPDSSTTDASVVTRMETRDRPTVYPYKNFNALQDAELLEKAMKGKGCDEEAVISILCGRTWRQRQEIAAAYERQYKKNLISVLKSETSGDFEDVIVTLMQSPALNDAIMLKDALKKKDHVIVNTIAFTRKNEELREIRRLYTEKHGSNLLDDVTKATSGQYEQLLVHSLAGEREQDNTGSRHDVEGDARALWDSGPKRPGTNMATYVNIFARRSVPHLRQVFQAYQQLTKSSIEQTVIDEMKGDDEKGFLALIKVIKNDSEFFVDQLVAATKGLGTNEKKLNHIIVSRAEIDLETIAETYQRLHKQPLEKLVQSETSGDYQRALLALVRGNAQGTGGAGHHTVLGGQQHLPPHSTGTVETLSESVTSTSTPPDGSVATRTETRDRPTVYPYKNFNALQDAALLEQAMKGKGCDEEAVINILCGRTWRQRQEIAAAYERQYRKNLISVLKSETSGDFEDVIVTLMQSPALNDAIMLKDAVKKKDHVILNTIAFTRKNEELREIQRLYAEKHAKNLLDDVKKATTGYYEQLLLLSFASCKALKQYKTSLLEGAVIGNEQGERDQDNAGDRRDVEGDARALWDAGPKRPGTNMATYVNIFARRSFAHLRQVFQAYQQLTKTSIEQTVVDEMKGDDEKGFLALIKVIRNDAEFFCDQLVSATKGLGTNEKKLNHTIVSRAEIDLGTIADSYQRLRTQPLEKLIQSETSGDYQRALLALVRGNAQGTGGAGHYTGTGGQQLPLRPAGTLATESFPVGQGNSNSLAMDTSVVTRTEIRDRPTVYPYKNFNALQDAELLERAMRGKGCDEAAVINILCARTWRQRQEIAAAYERQYRKNLISVLKSETSGDFEDVIVTLMQSPALNDAIMLKDALKKKDHVILNTIAFTRKNEELREIRRLYNEKHGSNLLDDVTKATSGQYEQLLVHSLAGERDQDNTGSRHDVDEDARALWESGPARPGTNMATYVNIFTRRSFAHLRHVFLRYQILTKSSIEQTVVNEMKGDDEKGFLALINVIKNDSEFFVAQLVAATKGLGTNEKKLNHIIVSRAEIDLGTIADTYQRLHKQPLEKLVQSETSGDYQRALLALVRGNAQGAGIAGHYTAANGGQQYLPDSSGKQYLPDSSGTVVKLSESVTSTETLPDNSVATRTETRNRPTVYPYNNFNALQDAALLEKAMKGKGCDEEAVINILCGRTWRQRQEIAAAYERQYRKNLISVLKSETSGDFEDVIVTLMQSPALNDAIILKDAIKKKDHVILNTIAFTRTNEDLREIRRLYAEKHGKNLPDAVKKATTGYYEQLLLLSFAGEREQDNVGGRRDVEGDARALWDAGPKRPGTNMATYVNIFARRSFAHLRQVFQAYQQLTKTSIEQTVVDEMKGDDEKGFLALIKVIKNDSEFFCDQLVAATKGLGTNEKKLNHTIVSRAEIDLGTIADTYQRLHKQPLEKLVQSETSGDYQRALLALIRGNASGQGTGGAGHYTAAGGPQHLPYTPGASIIPSDKITSPGSTAYPDKSLGTRTEMRDRPTVYPYRNFSALQDAELLEKAMRGKGCDEEAVINILCGRTWGQRQEIAAAYKQKYRKNLTSVLKSETSGDFEDVIVTLMQSPALNDAIMLKDAVKSKDRVILNTIAFTRKNEELREIHRQYTAKHGSNLLEDAKKATTTGYYQELLLLSLAGEREEDNGSKRSDVEADARVLWETGPARPGTNMVAYTTIFGRRSLAHLRQVFQVYQQVTNSSIEQTIKDEMKGDDEKGFLALIKVVKDDSEFFVEQLIAATKGLGTNEKKLNHIIVSRAEIDLGTTADTYQRLHKQPLEKLIQSETSGDYRRALLALVRGNEAHADRSQGAAGRYPGVGGQQPFATGASVKPSANASVKVGSSLVGQFNPTVITADNVATRNDRPINYPSKNFNTLQGAQSPDLATSTRDRPRVVPHRNFNANQDAMQLENAMRGKGCDEEAVINILCNRTWRQRQEIAAAYERQYKKNLVSVLKSETSGDFEDVIVTLMQSPAMNDVIMLKDALKSKDRVILNTIAFTKKPEELDEIQRLYAKKYGSQLQDDVHKATTGYYEQLLLMSLRGERDQDNSGRRDDVENDARALWDSGPARPGAMASTYTTIFGTRSFPHLRQVFQAYEPQNKTTIEQTIKDSMKGDDEKGFLALVKVIKNEPEFFADQLVAATKGLGTNEKKLNYIIVSRAEIDLDNIADEYQRLHKQPLEKLVESETSGDYKQALVTLVRGNADQGQGRGTGGQSTDIWPNRGPSTTVTGRPTPGTFSTGNSSSLGSGSRPTANGNDHGAPLMDTSGYPTVYPHQHFDHIRDAQLLEQAMKGRGCDEQAVVNILCSRTWRQRQAIATAYERQYRKQLLSVLKSETSGDFEDVILTLMQSPVLNDVNMLRDAIKKKDHGILNTIAFTKSNYELLEIRRLYAEKHKSELINDVEKATTGHYEQLLEHCLAGERDHDSAGSAYDALEDARALWESGPARPGTNMATYVNIFARRSFVHLRRVFQYYQMMTKSPMEKTIIDEMKGDDEKGYLALIKVIRNKAEFFVDQLVAATKGLGTNENKLNYIIVSRAEVDLGRIRDEYQALRKQPLEKLIEAETSGGYRKCLLALVKGNAVVAKDFRASFK